MRALHSLSSKDTYGFGEVPSSFQSQVGRELTRCAELEKELHAAFGSGSE